MASTHNTPFYGEAKIVSDIHYKLGSKLAMTNLDCLEYVWRNGKRLRVALIDYKHPGKSLSTKYDPIQAQADLARDLNLPFFFTLTYLEPTDFPIPMYYVIPVNEMAAGKITNINGKWMSVKEYALWLHKIRDINVPDKDIELVNNLSDQINKYALPDLSQMEILP
jgi:hypothetical protein